VPASAQRVLNERRAAPPAGLIRIHHHAGSVRVIGWERDTIAVSGTVMERGADRFYMGVSSHGSKLGIWASQGDSLPPSHLEIRVPRGAAVWIKTMSADAEVSGVSGGVDVYSVAGRIAVTGAPRELYAETMGGAISADVATRSARLKSASGAIELRGRIADAAVQNVSGTIAVRGGAIERGRFESVDGDVSYDGAVPRAASLDFITHGGRVRLGIPPDTRADVLVSTYAGQLENGFKVRALEGSNRFKGQEYTFALNGGGAQVSVRTFKGNVVLRPTQ
jgi:DUF4097 and DUF4098 domain-containing protein YvlB